MFFLREPADKPSVRTSMGSQLQPSPSSTAESQVSQRLLQLSEKASICSLLEILIWKKEDEFLTDAFYQLRLWNVVANHIHQFIHIP